MNNSSLSSNNQQDVPLSVWFLKSIVAGLGVILVVGFTIFIGMILLGGKYLVEQSEFTPYKINSMTLSVSKAPIETMRFVPAGVEVIQKTSDNQYLMTLFSGKTGDVQSKVYIKQVQ